MATTTVDKTIEEAQAAMTVKRAFGEPFQVDGLTIVPAARVAGGAGGANNKKGGSYGTGFGIVSQPMGVYVIDEHDAHWVPAATPNPLLAMLTAPFEAVRSLIFGRKPWETRLQKAQAKKAEAVVPVKARAARRPVRRARHTPA